MKKIKSKKSHDTVPLRVYGTYENIFTYSISSLQVFQTFWIQFPRALDLEGAVLTNPYLAVKKII